jgi:hypothetical protein
VASYRLILGSCVYRNVLVLKVIVSVVAGPNKIDKVFDVVSCVRIS